MSSRSEFAQPPVDLRTDIPHSARVYDYLMGGKTNYPPDRAAGDASARVWPSLPTSMKQARYFMHRSVRHLVREHGIRQFLDIGTGIPTPRTSMRSRRKSPPTLGSCTSTTTPSSSPTPVT